MKTLAKIKIEYHKKMVKVYTALKLYKKANRHLIKISKIVNQLYSVEIRQKAHKIVESVMEARKAHA